MNSASVVSLRGVSKSYDHHRAVDGISLEVLKAECFGLLGPNGAGKTSTLRMIYGTAAVGSGEVFVLGLNARERMREIKARIGIVPQEDGLESGFSVLENLLITADYHGMTGSVARRRAVDLLKWLHLEEFAGRAVDALSGGLRRRLVIARALLHEPELLILDEPTTGLDLQSRRWIWRFFKDLKVKGVSLVLTTHAMEEAAALCDRLAVMDHGRILAVGTPQELIDKMIGAEVVEFDTKAEDLAYYAGRLRQAGYHHQAFDRSISIHVRQGQNARAILDLISGDRVTVRRPTLDDVFLKLTGHHLRDEP